MLEMRDVARATEIVQGQDETVEAASDPTARLDVLGSGFRLPVHQHEAEPGHVHSDRDHVGRQDDVLGAKGAKGSPSGPARDTPSWLRCSGSSRDATRLLSSIASPSRLLGSPPNLPARKAM